ncbi:hypothetical protein CPB84DRAFT_1759461 [Gymnopilus junonius]|uniref:Uncharacterized protein n=1 Tax=Gymnopilus junonius TaxID=109634 RepID=A0A9P5P334_GYMJU|nr:hypothetical protein CPB84DRAFT_1759461 [Gymnopilus junonius]
MQRTFLLYGAPPLNACPPSSPSQTVSPSLTRGATAPLSSSPRLSTLNSGASRRPAAKSSSPTPNAEVNEALAASLKQETDQKEQLLRMDISDKLREQVRDLEKEKRDLQRRYNEQTATFDAERQAFYDNEQHLKSRIQSLSQARKTLPPAVLTRNGRYPTDEEQAVIHNQVPETKQDLNDPENEPAEMTSLKLELSTTLTSYSSLQSTLILMQTQLVDLKRVNQELQEENESYMILLREKTLSGQFDLIRQVGVASSDGDDSSATEENESTDVSSMGSLNRTPLDRVEEESEVMPSDDLEELSSQDVLHSSRGARHGRPERKRTSSTHFSRGESLADLPITGPGLDLAAELGRAENKDILAGNVIDDRERSALPAKARKGKKSQDGYKIPHSESAGLDSSISNADIDALRTEVKSLKDANKALSLYASKIIDRIIAQEGFEHVLAVDYEKNPEPPTLPRLFLPTARSQSVNFGRPSNAEVKPISTSSSASDPKAKRRSLSFDWSSFSLFNAEKKPEPAPSLRPLTLKPGAAHVTGARKLETVEDEEDRKERERLHATMKLMGIQPPAQSASRSPVPPAAERSSSAPNPTTKSNRRFSLFGSRTSSEKSDVPVNNSPSEPGQFNQSPFGLTEEALEHAEAQNSLAALDARERDLSAEIAKGAAGGFTEIARRTSRRGRKSAGGSSGSTVWSAGMSGHGDD